MLNITKITNNDTTTIALEGRLDSTTSPMLEKELSLLDTESSVLFDLERLVYISSAGLRVFLSVQKRMKGQGSMKLLHPQDDVMEILEVTGFVDILDIE